MTDVLEAARAALETLVLDVPDFPEPGIVFKDITPLLADPDGFAAVVAGLAEAGRDEHGATVVDAVVGLEARGFILAAPVALALGVGFVPVRKAGKLPPPTRSLTYGLEYGEATVEIREGTVPAGARVMLVDDVLATGGTAAAGAELLEQLGAEVVGLAFLLELDGLGGREKLVGRSVSTVLLAGS